MQILVPETTIMHLIRSFFYYIYKKNTNFILTVRMTPINRMVHCLETELTLSVECHGQELTAFEVPRTVRSR